MKTYCMNDAVYYKLTPKGKEIWENKNKKLKKKHPTRVWKINYYFEDWIADQLWCCFNRFGGQSGWGGDPLIYDITFDDPLKEVDTK